MCQTCKKLFARPSALATHERSHSKEKPHVCPFPTCRRPFAVPSNLRRHQRVYVRFSRRDGPVASCSRQRQKLAPIADVLAYGHLSHCRVTTIPSSLQQLVLLAPQRPANPSTPPAAQTSKVALPSRLYLSLCPPPHHNGRTTDHLRRKHPWGCLGCSEPEGSVPREVEG
ncbi:hypothetical protein BCR35DRAFT_8115 [Leucosporidium creatinivorum]|uniref:C2H2-type domain-containing protein n=1 Tax=Leucosporidium creatinivorum TaxID=106004 RepID=A0A1Y2G4B2_9BASI|nr:hypothetical protein BCR35DRAFT_8115 [Leucosporidium creatinivorum]